MTSAIADLRNSLSPDISKLQPSPNISNARARPQEPHCGELSRRLESKIRSTAKRRLTQVQTAVFVIPASAGSLEVSDSSCLLWFVRAREDCRSCVALSGGSRWCVHIRNSASRFSAGPFTEIMEASFSRWPQLGRSVEKSSLTPLRSMPIGGTLRPSRRVLRSQKAC